MAIPREYFDAVRAAQAATGRPFSPQTRDMNPIYTGKDVSFIDTKQMQRAAENTLLGAEKFATIAALTGARFPTEPIDKAWRQLLFGAHHDGITGSESDQVYLDLIGGWREALELGTTVLDGAIEHLAAQIETAGDGQAVTVFNALSWSRTDIARVEVDLPDDRSRGLDLRRRCRRARPVPGRIGRSARGGRAGPGDDRVPRPRRARRRLPDVPRASRLDPARRGRLAGGRHAGHRERDVRAVGRSVPRRRDRQPRRQAQRQAADQAGRGRQRAALVSRVPEPSALRRRPVAPDARRPVHVGHRLRDGGHRRGLADRPADPARRAVRGVAPRAGDPPVDRHRPRRADDVAP